MLLGLLLFVPGLITFIVGLIIGNLTVSLIGFGLIFSVLLVYGIKLKIQEERKYQKEREQNSTKSYSPYSTSNSMEDSEVIVETYEEREQREEKEKMDKAEQKRIMCRCTSCKYYEYLSSRPCSRMHDVHAKECYDYRSKFS